MSIRLHHELGECAVAVDTAQAVPAALAEMHAASGASRPVEEYVFEHVDGSGAVEALGEESGTLGEAGIVGCDEVVEMRLQGKYAARAQLAACGEDVYGWVGAEDDVDGSDGGGGSDDDDDSGDDSGDGGRGGARRQVRDAVARALAAGRSGRERLQLLAAAEVPHAGFVAGVAGRALAEQLARTGLGGGTAELLECCKQMGGENDAMGAALLHAADGVDGDDMTTMSRAELVGALVAEGAPLDLQDKDNNDTALIRACCHGHAEVAELLVNTGAALDVQGYENDTALIRACRKGLAEVAKLLVKKGAALDVQGQFNFTALLWACRNSLVEVAELLVNTGAALDVQGEYKDTPLISACRMGHAELAGLLVKKGAALDVPNKDNNTALHWACRNSLAEVAELLVKKGAVLDVQNKDNNTALLLACREGHAEVAELLVKKGAALDVQDTHGRTALFYALKNGMDDVAETMIRRGGTLGPDSVGSLTAQQKVKYQALCRELSCSEMRDMAEDDAPCRQGVTTHGLTALFHALKKAIDYVAEMMIRRGGRAVVTP